MNLSREPLPDRCPGQRSWHYDRAEIIADGVVHAIGVCLGLIGAVTIVVISVKMDRIEVAPIAMWLCALDFGLAYWTLRGMEVGLIALLLTSAAWLCLRLRDRWHSGEFFLFVVVCVAGVLTGRIRALYIRGHG